MTTTRQLLAIALAVGCGGERRAEAAAADSVEVAAAVPAAPARSRPADAEIVHVLAAANGVAVRASGHARPRVRTPAVAAFARTEAADHAAIDAQVGSLARVLGLTASEHGLGRTLTDEGAASLDAANALSGSAYEASYVAGEAAAHERTLELLDEVLIPAAQDERLRALLRDVRPAFAAHLQRALQLRHLLGTGALGADTASATTTTGS
jgi:putative membrane protein